MMQDDKLLTQYVRDGSEAAFSQLIARHLTLVYRACLRETGSAAQAEDAAQVVFLLLARKAKTLHSGPSLAGWLYRTAVFVAKDVRKQEARRTRREEAVMQEAVHAQAAPDPEWSTVEPFLDSALSALKPADREAVLLRFLEGHTLAETGDLLGLTEDAARMRVTRAVEKLRVYLTAHGAAVSGIALAALLTTEAAHPLSANAASAITQGTLQALSTGPTANVLLLSKGVTHTMKIIKIKYAALAAAVLLTGAAVPPLVHALSPHKARTVQVSQTSPVGDAALSQLTIPGDYTLTYIVQSRDLLTPQQRKDPRMKPYLTTRPMTLTLSERGGKFLYRLMSKQSATDWGSFIMLYDGSNSFEYDYSDHRGDIYTGLYGGRLSFMPIPSTYMANLPVFRNIHSLGSGNFEGNIFYPYGNPEGAIGTSAYGKTRIHMENSNNLFRVTKYETLGPENTYIFPTTISAFVKFKGVWVPSRMSRTIENTDQDTWALADMKPTSEPPASFDYHSYLHSGDIVQNDIDPENPRSISYLPGMDVFR